MDCTYNRPIGIRGQGNTQSREHTNGSHGDTVFIRQGITAENGGDDNQNGEYRRDHADTQTLNNDRGWTSDTRFGNRLGRPIRIARKVFRDLTNENTGGETNADTSKDLPAFGGATVKDKVDNDGAKANDQDTADNGALVERKHEFFLSSAVLGTDGKVSDHGGNDTRSGNPDGEEDLGDISIGKCNGSNNGPDLCFIKGKEIKSCEVVCEKANLRQPLKLQQKCELPNGTYKGFKQIGSHSSHISHIITDIVSNHSRVARVVFRNVHFDFSDEIGANVGRLGVDSASNTGLYNKTKKQNKEEEQCEKRDGSSKY